MPKLTIDTTSAQAQRVAAAFGRVYNKRTPDKSAQRDATAAEVKEIVIDFLRGVVLNYEQDVAMQAASSTVPDITPT